MDFKELSATRQSCRSYCDKIVSRDIIDEILTCAQQAPSACNSQPWHFVACDGETSATLATYLTIKEHPINQWAVQVPSFVVMCEMPARLMGGEMSQKYAQMDIGIACATICYAAQDKGVSSCIIGCFQEEKIKELLNIPQEAVIRLVVALGYASEDDALRNKRRKEFENIVSYNVW